MDTRIQIIWIELARAVVEAFIQEVYGEDTTASEGGSNLLH